MLEQNIDKRTVWILEEDLPVDTAGSDEGGIERFDLVGSHDDFDVAAVVETIELVE